MPVDKVLGSTWCPTTWLTRIQCVADKALRRLLPCLNASTQKQRIVKPVMWLSEEMMANLLPNDSISIAGLKKITVHANLLLPCNVVVWNHKVLQTVYEEMERQDGERTTWHLDKFITKLRLPGCFKRLDDGSHVRRLVPSCMRGTARNRGKASTWRSSGHFLPKPNFIAKNILVPRVYRMVK